MGPIRKALWECLQSWAVLGLSFVGGSIMKVITDRGLKSRLVETRRRMDVIKIEIFDIFGEGVERNTPKNTLNGRAK